MAANKINAETKRKFLTVYVPDTRGVEFSRYGKGNLKIGMDGVYTYSRLPGTPSAYALGIGNINQDARRAMPLTAMRGTCPGATEECQSICYAARPVVESGLVFTMWQRNTVREDVPPIPDDCKILRIHVSGDFTSEEYISQWIARIAVRPAVRAFAYTRSWRVPELLPALERLRALPNMQLFASMDANTKELPPMGWRRAWITGDDRLHPVAGSGGRLDIAVPVVSARSRSSLVCPEETGHKANCEACRYCIDGKRNDVTFLKH